MQRRTFLPLLAGGAGLCFGQDTMPDQTIRTTVNVVLAPVTVRDRAGNFVNDLEAKDFTLYDNDKVQNIKVDQSYIPISLVVAIQANADVEKMLPAIKTIGPLIEHLVIGSDGEAAFLAFDHRIREIQSFTNDSRLMEKALQGLYPGSSTSAMIDAVYQGVRLLRNRPSNHRRILLLISETRDKGSEGGLKEALTEATIHNVLVYSININRAIGMLTKKMPVPREDPFPPGARPIPPGAPMTPGTTEALTGYRGATTNFIPVFKEIFTQVKGLFVDNPLEVLTRYTGGREFSFLTQHDLEEQITQLGEELHSQYLLTYTPNDMEEGGWHEIRVAVARPGVKPSTRDGYWMAAVPH